MITKVEASGYRCLRQVSQELQPYQILVGPNGSGKSAFLDVIAFLGDLVSRGLAEAVSDRTENFYDLVWGRTDGSFRLAIEAKRPRTEDRDAHPSYGSIRYEIQAEIGSSGDELAISSERLIVTDARGNQLPVIMRDGRQVSLAAEMGGNRFAFEPHPNYPSLATLATLPLEKTGFPSAASLKDLLRDGVKTVALDNELLRGSSPPGSNGSAVYDGLNLSRL